MPYKPRPREQGRYRVTHKHATDRLFTLPEMAEILAMDPHALWVRLRKHDPSIPPAFQPGGPGTAWKFSERSYQQWLATYDEMEAREG